MNRGDDVERLTIYASCLDWIGTCSAVRRGGRHGSAPRTGCPARQRGGADPRWLANDEAPTAYVPRATYHDPVAERNRSVGTRPRLRFPSACSRVRTREAFVGSDGAAGRARTLVREAVKTTIQFPLLPLQRSSLDGFDERAQAGGERFGERRRFTRPEREAERTDRIRGRRWASACGR